MKHRIVATCLTAVALAFTNASSARSATTAVADTPQYLPISRPTMSVVGQATATRVPDRGIVVFEIQTNNDVAAKAASDSANITNRLFNAVIALGVPRNAIATGRYTIENRPRPQKVDPTDTTLYGTIITRQQRVTVDTVDNVGAVIDAGIDAGAKSVQNVSFVLRDPHAAARELLADATADAIAQANTLAAAAHVRLRRILAISPDGNSFGLPQPVPMAYSATIGRMESRAIPTTVDPGELNLHATVRIEYEIGP